MKVRHFIAFGNNGNVGNIGNIGYICNIANIGEIGNIGNINYSRKVPKECKKKMKVFPENCFLKRFYKKFF